MNLKSINIFSRIKRPSQNNEEINNDTLSGITRESEIIIFKTKTVFPFTIFPDTIIIDLHKINVIKKDFFLTERVNSIQHEDILNVAVATGPLFATLKIYTRFFTGKPISIVYLKKSDALLAKQLIHGLIIAHRKGVSLRDVEIRELLSNLQQLGSAE
jgi:hypothetical protein